MSETSLKQKQQRFERSQLNNFIASSRQDGIEVISAPSKLSLAEQRKAAIARHRAK